MINYRFALLGYPLEHSFSPNYFRGRIREEGLDARYEVIEMRSAEDFPKLFEETKWRGFNVTMPLKETIIPYLDEIDETAAAIGAVNVLRVDYHGATSYIIGYNTDCIGFRRSLEPLLTDFHRQALVLGTGGAAKAICYALAAMNIAVTVVSRDAAKGLTYEQLDAEIIARHGLIVNTTPLGMTPLEAIAPMIPYHALTAEHLLYDVIYNPQESLFLQQGRAQGAATKNGLEMLTLQAEAAWELFFGD